MKLKDKNLIIVGASSGIGEALALQLMHQGNKLALFSRREPQLAELKRSLFIQGDLLSLDQVKAAAKIFSESLGRIDGLIFTAGISDYTEIEGFKTQQAVEMIQVNYFGFLYWVECLLPGFIERREGLIAAVSALGSERGLPRAAAYGASKAALSYFLESLRIDTRKYGIQVSDIRPGYVKTPMSEKYHYDQPFLISANEAAETILRALGKGKTNISFPMGLSILSRLVNLLPNGLYDHLMLKVSEKAHKKITKS